jgi:hypothetical protein
MMAKIKRLAFTCADKSRRRKKFNRNLSFVLLQARDPVEAIRLRANRLKMWKNGVLLAQTPGGSTQLLLPGRAAATGFMT